MVRVLALAALRHFAYAAALGCGVKKENTDLVHLLCFSFCNCYHYFSSKARLIRGPDMILQEVRGECIASVVPSYYCFLVERF